ncbi:DUF2000 domain-containing protein [Streptomyces malaysiensis]|uniref:DUF2000 domain-containing protein n=1 Tax=Streptomyces malaysiensis TaxID=92644 RepID=A0A7X5XBD0_STRMQ|nr:DUF2000 domain-containing protein [Streptomyces malaysiensis]NIY69355.1 hypothetical protein [Streptomyces malaysiensis]
MGDKLVIVVDEGLDRGVAANVIGLVGISIGHHINNIVGPDIHDAAGRLHLGMSTIGLPVLGADADGLVRIHQATAEHSEVTVLDVTDAAVSSRDYASYTERLRDPSQDWRPLGLALFGSRRQVDRLTGRLGLLR